MSERFRWQREGWLAGSVVVAALVIATAAVVGRSPEQEPAAVRPNGSAAAPPAPVVSPPASPEPLPDRGGLGRAEYVYWGCQGQCRPVVRFHDGQEFEVPTDTTSARGVTLSPDRRWLGYPLGTGLVVRDLVRQSSELRFDGPPADRRLTAWAWSADSSVLLIGEEGVDQVPATFTLLRLGDGLATTPVPAVPGHEVLGVRTPVELLVARPDAAAGPRVDLALGTAAGTIATRFTVDASAQLRDGERLVTNGVRFSGSGFEAVALNREDEPAAVVRFGANGPVVRHDLPPRRGPERWSYLGVGPDGTVFAVHDRGRTQLRYVAPDGSVTAGPVLPADPVRVVPPGVAVY